MGCQNEESFNQLLDSIANNKNPQNEGKVFFIGNGVGNRIVL